MRLAVIALLLSNLVALGHANARSLNLVQTSGPTTPGPSDLITFDVVLELEAGEDLALVSATVDIVGAEWQSATQEPFLIVNGVPLVVAHNPPIGGTLRVGRWSLMAPGVPALGPATVLLGTGTFRAVLGEVAITLDTSVGDSEGTQILDGQQQDVSGQATYGNFASSFDCDGFGGPASLTPLGGPGGDAAAIASGQNNALEYASDTASGVVDFDLATPPGYQYARLWGDIDPEVVSLHGRSSGFDSPRSYYLYRVDFALDGPSRWRLEGEIRRYVDEPTGIRYSLTKVDAPLGSPIALVASGGFDGPDAPAVSFDEVLCLVSGTYRLHVVGDGYPEDEVDLTLSLVSGLPPAVPAMSAPGWGVLAASLVAVALALWLARPAGRRSAP